MLEKTLIFIFGDGKWSKNHQKILSLMGNVIFKTFDIDTTPEKVLLKYGLPAAVLVTASTENHHLLTMFFLEKNIPVFCEKPICLKLWQLEELKSFVKSKPIFMAGHQLVFDPTVNSIAREKNALFFSSKRTGAIPRTEGAVMSLAVHDIAIAMHLFDYDEPVSIKASGNQHSAQINIEWSDNRSADIFVQSISTIKLRHATIVTNNKLTDFPSRVIQINPDCWDRTNLLELELKYFIDCVKSNFYPHFNNLEKAITVTKATIEAMRCIERNE